MGEFIGRRKPLVGLDHLQGGLIIDLPEMGVEEYLKNILDIEQLPSDEDLINHLETLIEKHRKKKR
jgi:hypothetical protein